MLECWSAAAGVALGPYYYYYCYYYYPGTTTTTTTTTTTGTVKLCGTLRYVPAHYIEAVTGGHYVIGDR